MQSLDDLMKRYGYDNELDLIQLLLNNKDKLNKNREVVAYSNGKWQIADAALKPLDAMVKKELKKETAKAKSIEAEASSEELPQTDPEALMDWQKAQLEWQQKSLREQTRRAEKAEEENTLLKKKSKEFAETAASRISNLLDTQKKQEEKLIESQNQIDAQTAEIARLGQEAVEIRQRADEQVSKIKRENIGLKNEIDKLRLVSDQKDLEIKEYKNQISQLEKDNLEATTTINRMREKFCQVANFIEEIPMIFGEFLPQKSLPKQEKAEEKVEAVSVVKAPEIEPEAEIIPKIEESQVQESEQIELKAKVEEVSESHVEKAVSEASVSVEDNLAQTEEKQPVQEKDSEDEIADINMYSPGKEQETSTIAITEANEDIVAIKTRRIQRSGPSIGATALVPKEWAEASVQNNNDPSAFTASVEDNKPQKRSVLRKIKDFFIAA